MDLIISRHTFRQNTLTSKKANIFALIDSVLVDVMSSLDVQLMSQICCFLGDVRESVADNQLTITDESQISLVAIEQLVEQLERAVSPASEVAVDVIQIFFQLIDALLLVSSN